MLDECGWTKAARALRDSGVSAVALCPLVLYDRESSSSQLTQTAENLRLLEQIAELGINSVVVITGGLPPDSKNLNDQRKVALEELEKLVPTARSLSLTLALEPLHPVLCGTRSVLTNLAGANEMLDVIAEDDVLGIAIDSYALWWDTRLQEQIEKTRGRIRHLHVSDWLPNTRDIRLDRGMPGDGLIDNPRIRSWVENTGFQGSVEVELFSAYDWWLKSPEQVVQTICDRLEYL